MGIGRARGGHYRPTFYVAYPYSAIMTLVLGYLPEPLRERVNMESGLGFYISGFFF